MTDSREALRVLITGASRGIGAELLEHYVARGEDAKGMSTEDCDLGSWEETSRYFEQDQHAEVDLLVHCAAVNRNRFFYKLTPQEFKEMVGVNVIGTFHLLKCMIPRLKAQGSIVLLSSVAAFAPRMGQSAYACCKSALHGLVKVLAGELLPEDKYIFLIAPGVVEVGMPMHMMSETVRGKALEAIPLGRFCRIREIVATIEYARSTPCLTGQTIHLNGGYCIP